MMSLDGSIDSRLAEVCTHSLTPKSGTENLPIPTDIGSSLGTWFAEVAYKLLAACLHHSQTLISVQEDPK